VTSKKKSWNISKIAKSAKRNIEALDSEYKEQVIKRFECLQENPFKGDIKRLRERKIFIGLAKN